MNERANVSLRELYLELLKKQLIGMLYEDPSLGNPQIGGYTSQHYVKKFREWGRDCPQNALSMIGLRRMNNIQQCFEQIVADRVPGDLIETGVWRGGATIFMRGLLAAYEVMDRVVWVADSFQGLPTPNAKVYPQDKQWFASLEMLRHLAVSQEEVRHNFALYDLLDNQVRFLPGWFHETLPNAPIHQLAILRLDGDFYSSTWETLSALYPKVAPGGFIIVDDYRIEPCRLAVEDYRAKHGIIEPAQWIDTDAVFWRRSL